MPLAKAMSRLRPVGPPAAGIIVTILALIVCASFAHGRGQTRPADAPRDPFLFAPGAVSIGGLTTCRPTFSPDGRTVYFTVDARGGYVIAASRRRGLNWSQPELVSFSGQYSDAEAFLISDGSRLYFAPQRPLRAGEPAREDYDLWMVERGGDGRFGAPRHLGPAVNTARMNSTLPSAPQERSISRVRIRVIGPTCGEPRPRMGFMKARNGSRPSSIRTCGKPASISRLTKATSCSNLTVPAAGVIPIFTEAIVKARAGRSRAILDCRSARPLQKRLRWDGQTKCTADFPFG